MKKLTLLGILFLRIFLLFVFISSSLFAQNIYQIEGEVKDSISKLPIPFATVSMKNNSTKGTICNGDGYFVFKIHENDLTDHIVFSCMVKIIRLFYIQIGNMIAMHW